MSENFLQNYKALIKVQVLAISYPKKDLYWDLESYFTCLEWKKGLIIFMTKSYKNGHCALWQNYDIFH